MRCEVGHTERWPTLSLDRIGSKAKDDPKLVDVPPALINAVQKAEEALTQAELAVLEHLEKTGQPVLPVLQELREALSRNPRAVVE